MVLVCIGFAVALMNLCPDPDAGVCVAAAELAILPEERYLESKFGEAYLAYKRRVRRWI